MKLALLTCLALVVASKAWAHRLDEYLQATRIAVNSNRIDVSLELTPGVAIANQLVAVIDRDHDGQISKREAATYKQRVLNDLKIQLDDKPLTLPVIETSFPLLKEMKTGEGVIRIKAVIPVEALSSGNHTLSLTNAHLPSMSVYLVNALAPKDPAIKITKQTRDELQKDYRMEFSFDPAR